MKSTLLSFVVLLTSLLTTQELVTTPEVSAQDFESCEAVALQVTDAYLPKEVVAADTLESNQAELFYMYSDNNGHYFLDPSTDTENVIYVGKYDYKQSPGLKVNVKELHHGMKFVGTFEDDTLWELVGLEAVKK